MLKECASCFTRFAHDLLRCPQCSCTDYKDAPGGEPAPDAPVLSADDSGGEPATTMHPVGTFAPVELPAAETEKLADPTPLTDPPVTFEVALATGEQEPAA